MLIRKFPRPFIVLQLIALALPLACQEKDKNDNKSTRTSPPEQDEAPDDTNTDPSSEENLDRFSSDNANPASSEAAGDWSFSLKESIKVAVFGDSLATGFIADREYGIFDSVNGAYEKKILVPSFFGSPIPEETYGSKELNPSALSAYSGSESYSLPYVLAEGHSLGQVPTKAQITNYSFVGATAFDMNEYSIETQDIDEADYAIIELGSNDFCQAASITAENYFSEMENLLLTLASLPVMAKTRFIVMGTANFQALSQIGNDVTVLNQTINIKEARKALCPALAGDVTDRQKAFQNARAEAFAILKDNLGPEQSAALMTDIDQMTITESDLSLDGFHLSKQGHEKLGLAIKAQLPVN